MKRFNITGDCSPDRDYMVDTSHKIEIIFKMIEYGDYIVINRPRQYGKTTTLILLEKALLNTDEYLPIKISFEGKGSTLFRTEKLFCSAFLGLLADYYIVEREGYNALFHEKAKTVNNFIALSKALTEIIQKIGKKIVLMIDEVDKSSNNDVFLDFLGMLRDKFLLRKSQGHITFQSVILAGITDVKNLKRKIKERAGTMNGNSTNQNYNSPWNIAVDFEIDMSFNQPEIQTMLKDYCSETSNQMSISEISDRLYFWTNGYPFLVSKLCKIIDESLLPTQGNRAWISTDVDNAVKIFSLELNSLFDDIIKNLTNNKELFNFIQSLILGAETKKFVISNPIINLAYMYGYITRCENGSIKIHNKIFEEIMTDHIVSVNIENKKKLFINPTQELFLKDDGNLDFDLVLLKFQESIKTKYSDKDLLKSKEFSESNLRMVFLMYLQPIINGVGFSYKEVEIGAEKRLDVIVVFRDEKFIVELKIWHGEKYHEQGKKQLKKYMELESINKGYMLIMNKNQKKRFYHEIEDEILMVYL
jgi:hypothetical protein